MTHPNYVRRWWFALAFAGLIFAATPVKAFYWIGWPGLTVAATDRTLIPPAYANTPGNPPGPTPPSANPFPPPTEIPTEVSPGEKPPPPGNVPEPATSVVGLLGLATVAVMRWRNRHRI